MTTVHATQPVRPVTADIMRVGIGTATRIPGYGVGGDEPMVNPETLLQSAIDAEGITYVDTAGVYGDAEACLGRLNDLMERHRVRVCTKVEPNAHAAESLLASLQRLRMNAVDTVLLHSAGVQELTNESIIGPLIAARDRGLTKRIGASTYGLQAALAAIDQAWCDTVQVEHSILNQSVAPKIAAIKRLDQELIVRSVLCKGLLTGRRRRAEFQEHAEASRVLTQLDQLAGSWGSDPLPVLAIRFALDTPGVDLVLVGLGSVTELTVTMEAVRRGPLSPAHYQQLAVFDRSLESWTHPERWQRPEQGTAPV